MKKKMMSLALALAMCLSLCVPAFAATSAESKSSENATAIFTDCGNGLYQPATGNSLRVISSDSTIQATSTENSDIYCIESRSFDNNYVLTERQEVDVDTFDPEDYSDIPVEVLENIKVEIEKQQQVGNEEFTVAIYAPASATARNYWGGIYTYGPYQLKDYFVELGNARTGWVEKKGTTASTWSSELTSVVISVVGLKSKKVSIFSTGISVLDYALKQAGISKLSKTTSNDSVEEDTVYSKLGKSTYVLDNDAWLFSLGTTKVTLKELNTYSFFTETGSTSYISSNPNTTLTSENYDNPRMAIQMLGVGFFDDPIEHTVMGKSFAM